MEVHMYSLHFLWQKALCLSLNSSVEWEIWITRVTLKFLFSFFTTKMFACCCEIPRNSVERAGVRGCMSLRCYEACGNCFNGGMALKTVMDTHILRSTFGTWQRKQRTASPTQIFFFMTPCRKWLQSWTRYDNYFHLTFTPPQQFYPHKPLIPTYFFSRSECTFAFAEMSKTFKFDHSWYQLIHFKICGYDFEIRSVNELSKALCTSWLLKDSAWFQRKEEYYWIIQIIV